jgi:hypothetical protein
MKNLNIIFSLVVWIPLLILILMIWLSYSIDKWYTNANSEVTVIQTWISSEIPESMRQVHKYLSEHPQDSEWIIEAYKYMHWTWNNWKEWFPKHLLNDKWFMFVVNWYKERKEIYETIIKISNYLQIEPELVLSSLMWEQVRILTKWARWNLKWIVTNMSPRFLVSYNTSLWIGWIKQTTAYEIEKDAKKYWYGKITRSPTEESLTKSNYYQALYPTYLVKNILTRWSMEWYDISKKPWVVWTLYNMGNNKNKIPHENPQIWWAVIKAWWKEYSYGWISMVIYWYLKIYK